jgi:hypothetical protein
MKLKLMTLLLLFSIAAKSQTSTAFAWYFINKTGNGKDVYLFTSPKAFTYPKGSSYAFAPVAFEKIAQKTIEQKLKEYDPYFNGLYVNQISNGANTSLKNLENTNQEIKNKMLQIYQDQKNATYRGSDVKIALIDFETGSMISEYTLPATTIKTKNGSAGNGN